MASEGMENGMGPAIVFHDDGTSAFGSGRKTAPVGGFVDQKLFSDERERYFRGQGEFRRGVFCSDEERRNGGGGSSQEVGQSRRSDGREWCPRDGSDGDDDDDDDDEDEDEDDDDDDDGGDGEVEALVNGKGGRKPIVAANDGGKENNINGSSNNGSGSSNNNTSGGSLLSVSEKVREGNLERDNAGNKGNSEKHHPPFGIGRGVLGKDLTVCSSNSAGGGLNECQPGRLDDCSSTRYENAVTVAEPDSYYPHILQGTSISIAHKEAGGENGCGFSGRKDPSLSGEPGDSLRTILSDPLTGSLMDDAMILTCGHSFGGGGIQQVLRMQACYTCGHAISADSVAPNLSLRSAVQAFRREEEFQLSKASKRRRERFEQEKGGFGDPLLMDGSRCRGVQFPFAVGDRVIIKGNKRTPQRFVGREAVVTTQCLNGWYVVKTLDNAESVKLQYRSLSKVGTRPPSNGLSTKAVGPNWL